MRKVKKSYKQRKEELRRGLYRLEGALTRFRDTREVAELGTVAIELRGLVCGEALLLDLATEKNFPLQLYTLPPGVLDKLKPILGPQSILWAGDSVSLKREPPYIYKMTIKEWLKTEVADVYGSRFTGERLINEVANSLGPAHYSPDMSRPLAEMQKYEIGGIRSHYRTLFNFAEVVLKLGHDFLASY